MTANRYDAIVIGGGHNGLVAAAYLAKHGARTVVLESRAGSGEVSVYLSGGLVRAASGGRGRRRAGTARQCVAELPPLVGGGVEGA